MTPDQRSDVAALVAAALVGLVLFMTGWLLRPDMPEGPYVVEWTPDRHGVVPYGGRLILTAAGPFPVRPGPVSTSGNASEIVRRGGIVLLATIAAGPPEGMAPLLAFYDSGGDEVAMLGVQGNDVLYRQRTRASRFRLHSPAVRLNDGLASISPGDTLRLVTFNGRGGRCIQVQNDSACELGHSAGSGWTLLAGDRQSGGRTGQAFNAAWLALLLLPVGWIARPKVAAIILIAAVWYMVIRLPVDTVLLPAPHSDMAGAIAGLVTGGLIRWKRRRSETEPAAPENAEPAAPPDTAPAGA
jgi:hypothetical protein